MSEEEDSSGLTALQKSRLFRQRVLVVEDDDQGAALIRMVLSDLGVGHQARAKDGADAWYQLTTADQPFTLVISDWNMPGMTGLELLEKIRGERSRDLPFIMITGRGMVDSAVEAKVAGVTTYIPKPYTPQQLSQKIVDSVCREE